MASGRYEQTSQVDDAVEPELDENVRTLDGRWTNNEHSRPVYDLRWNYFPAVTEFISK